VCEDEENNLKVFEKCMLKSVLSSKKEKVREDVCRKLPGKELPNMRYGLLVSNTLKIKDWYQRFGGICCFSLQGWRHSHEKAKLRYRNSSCFSYSSSFRMIC
jgi:hypothetical protein